MRHNYTYNTCFVTSKPDSQRQTHHLDPVPKLAHLLLIIPSRQSASRSQCNRHWRTSTRLDNSRDCRTHEQNTVAQGKLSAVILVLLDAVACRVSTCSSLQAKGSLPRRNFGLKGGCRGLAFSRTQIHQHSPSSHFVIFWSIKFLPRETLFPPSTAV